jgi:hypothetical protein
MLWLVGALLLSGFYPLGTAWQANRRTSLRDAVLWAALAWASWSVPLLVDQPAESIFVALSCSGCAGIAVLGARRPHVFAWNFVVLGLLCVLLLPLAEQWVIGTRSFDLLRLVFLAATLAIGTLNYLPTRFGFAAAVATLVGGGWLAVLVQPAWFDELWIGWTLRIATLSIPWLALLSPARRTDDPLRNGWLRFRDRMGLVWGQRTREHFNRAAEHAGLPIRLGWSGPIATGTIAEQEQARAVRILDGLTKRFLDADA